MKMLVFYRSRECTNAIASSTMSKLKNHKELKGLDVEFINLDKRSYQKVLKKMEEENDLPKFVYIWYDEEKVTDYINETYPTIEVIHFNMEMAVGKRYKFLCDYPSNDYRLTNMIIEKFKDNLVKKTVYEVDTTKNYKIVTRLMDDFDIGCSQKKIFLTEAEAREYCINTIREKIVKKTEDAEYYTSLGKSCKKEATRLQKLLKEKFGSDEKGDLPF